MTTKHTEEFTRETVRIVKSITCIALSPQGGPFGVTNRKILLHCGKRITCDNAAPA
jgi:hypothetical protein